LFKYIEKRKVWLVYVPLVFYWILLFTATTLPGKDLPDLGFSDKIQHFSAFFVLAVLLNLALIYQRKFYFLFKNASIATIIITLSYGAFDEIHQLYISGRYADIRDWLADSSGVIIGILLLNVLKNILNYNINFE
jgi:VanZ family protein